jgi:hypothetical protein
MLATIAQKGGVWFVFRLWRKMNHLFSLLCECSEQHLNSYNIIYTQRILILFIFKISQRYKKGNTLKARGDKFFQSLPGLESFILFEPNFPSLKDFESFKLFEPNFPSLKDFERYAIT